MNVENKTIIKDLDLGFEIDPSRPVTCYSKTIIKGKCEVAHSHPRAQVIYANKGIMRVVTSSQVWIVTPLQGIWVPGFEEHQVFFPDNVEVKTLFVDPSVTKNLPDNCFAFDMTAFLRELIVKIISFKKSQLTSQRGRRVIDVLLDELKYIVPTSLFLPTSNEHRVHRVTQALINDISGKKPLSFYAGSVNVSSRTLSRLFIKELGMSFSQWRIRLKILEAMKRLEEGQPVKEIGFDLGYENPSTFVYMFRKYVGKSPTHFRR